ncbi:MAG: DUF3298 domain-containing protein [Planctomycetes bacterium]|nr:DUF3298 domain-containing protein [Planctomycetota bacterium]
MGVLVSVRSAATLLPFLLVPSLAAQVVTWPTSASHWLCGSITAKGTPLRIQMALSFADEQGAATKVVGEYRYVHKGLPIRVEGRYDADRHTLELDEFVVHRQGEAERCSGHFRGTTQPGLLAATGTWSAGDGTAGVPFTLRLEAVARTASVREPLAYSWEEDMVSFLGDHALAREATARIRKEGLERLDGGPTAVRKEVAEWLDASHASGSSLVPTQMSGGHRFGVHFVAERLVSLGGLVHEFTGGAHPNSALTCLNLVQRGDTVRELKLADLAAGKDAAPRLHRLVYDDLRRQGASGAPSPKEPPTDFDALDTFVVSPAGVLFGFSPYEVGCYAEGCYYVHLDWTQLRGALNAPPELGVAAAK